MERPTALCSGRLLRSVTKNALEAGHDSAHPAQSWGSIRQRRLLRWFVLVLRARPALIRPKLGRLFMFGLGLLLLLLLLAFSSRCCSLRLHRSPDSARTDWKPLLCACRHLLRPPVASHARCLHPIYGEVSLKFMDSKFRLMIYLRCKA
jgi:hypothetical protein